jgi:alpha-methylacyl-CoA racemase
VLQPGPAPRFSRTRPELGSEPQVRGAGGEAVLTDWGFGAAEIAELGKSGVIGAAKA